MKRQKTNSLKSNLLLFSEVFGVVAIWRGIWTLMDMYLFPDRPELSALVGIGIGVFILLVDDRLISEVSNRVHT